MKTHLELVVVAALLPLVAAAQPPPAPLTINQAVQQATDRYPAVRSSVERVNSAAAAIDLARTAYLPRTDLLGQLNRATRNNIFGLVLPQSVIPGISGPVLGTNDLTNVWGSAVGVLVSWEPFDFGLRRANVETAQSAGRLAQTGVDVTRFEVQASTADAFLTLLAAQETVVAARAGVERARVFRDVVESLAKSGLRPGADAARARAELAAAETQLIRAEQAVGVARASLSQLVGVPPSQLSPEAGPLLRLPPDMPQSSGMQADHPLARQQNAAVQQVKAAEHALSRSYFPRFDLQASTYARGTGARPDGGTGGALSGFGPNIQNWAVGMTLSFPAFDLPSIRARRRFELHRERAETAQYDRILQDLGGQLEKARAQLDGARRVANNTPLELEAARAADEQATARYRSGLGNIVEVAEAQRLLTQAETEDALARLSVWRGLLAVAAASGDLQPFLQLAAK